MSGARIQHFAAMVRDGNPSYWDAEFAGSVWGGLVAPPALLTGLLMPPPWMPGGKRPTASIAIRIPLPGTAIINASNDAEYLAPVIEGDRLSMVEEVVSVSPEKTTRLGVGHFIETLDTYYRGDGTGRDEPQHIVPLHPFWRLMTTWADIAVPADLPEVGRRDQLRTRGDERRRRRGTTCPGITIPVTPKDTAIQHFRQHHAHRRVRRPDRDRLGGPYSRVVRRKVSLLGSIYAGDSMVGRGRVVGKRCELR